MRFISSIVVTSILSYLAVVFLTWWSMLLVVFIVAIILGFSPGRAFGFGFLSVILFWLVVILFKDIANEHILSARMAVLFGLPNFFVFVIVNIVLGGILGGLAGFSGAYMGVAFRNRK